MRFIHNKILELRNLHHRSQAEVAEAIGVTQSNYSRFERGQVGIEINRLLKLAEFYDVDFLEFFEGSKSEKEKEDSKKMEDWKIEYYKLCGRYEELEKRYNDLFLDWPAKIHKRPGLAEN